MPILTSATGPNVDGAKKPLCADCRLFIKCKATTLEGVLAGEFCIYDTKSPDSD